MRGEREIVAKLGLIDDQINLIQDQHSRRIGHDLGQLPRDLPIFVRRRLGGVKNPQDDVGFFQGVMGGVDHVAPHSRLGLVDAGTVNKQYLGRGAGVDAQLALPRRLRLGADDGDLLAEDGVYERRLADIGPPHHRDQARAMILPPVIAENRIQLTHSAARHSHCQIAGDSAASARAWRRRHRQSAPPAWPAANHPEARR